MNSFRSAFRREVKRFISRVGCERRSEDPLALDRLPGCRAPKPSIKSAFSFHQERRGGESSGGITIRERPLRSSSFSHKITPEDARPLGRVIFFLDDGASLRHPGITGLV
jgi:hypothetical protein